MTKPIFSALLLSVSVLAQNTIFNGAGGGEIPALSGNCTGVGNLPDVRIKDPVLRRQRFLQTNIIDAVNNTFEFTLDDIDDCCTGNGDFQFLKRYLQIQGKAEDKEDEGFDAIPGDSLWTCTRECRSLAGTISDKTLDECYRACFCRQNCPNSDDCLTADCKAACTFPEFSLEQDICIDECSRQCGERCRSTLNGYVVPIDIYGEAVFILDCFYGDIIGDREGSCNTAKAFWESTGHACVITEEEGLECNCIVPGTCYNEIFPCPYEFHCTSEAPSLSPSESPSDVPSFNPSFVPSESPSDVPSFNPSFVPSESPSDVPSSNPSSEPSLEPTPLPTPCPTKGKGKGKGYRWRPTDLPTKRPSRPPTKRPTLPPTKFPTKFPTKTPSPPPTKSPSKGPTAPPNEPLEMDDDKDDDWKEEDDNNKDPDDHDDDWKEGVLGTLREYGSNPQHTLGHCEGDCDSDLDCNNDELVCFQRDANEGVPGCLGGLQDGSLNDYCVRKSDLYVKPIQGAIPLKYTTEFPLARCEGDCDTNDDCEGDLVCFQRDANVAVPGCDGGELDGSYTDYCVFPSSV